MKKLMFMYEEIFTKITILKVNKNLNNLQKTDLEFLLKVFIQGQY